MLSFKTSRERDEYAALREHNPKLQDMLIDLVPYVQNKMGKDVVVTSIYRSPDEQNELYTNEPKKVPNSPHETWQAADLRSSIYTQAERDDICSYLNTHWHNANGKIVAFCHAIAGNVMHFHISLYRD